MMHTILFVLMISYSFIGFSDRAEAQAKGGATQNRFYFEETFFPVYVSKNDADKTIGGSPDKDVATESGLGFDARTTLGYVWNNVLFGLTYNIYQVDTSRSATVDYEAVDSSTSRSEYGPTIGYFLSNWRFAFTYFLNGTKKIDRKDTDNTGVVQTDETYKNSDGSGFQFALGYAFNIGAGFSISPTLIYRSVKYSEQTYTVRTGAGIPYSTSLQSAAVDTELKPMITFSYSF